jgi:hypothetical protein
LDIEAEIRQNFLLPDASGHVAEGDKRTHGFAIRLRLTALLPSAKDGSTGCLS